MKGEQLAQGQGTHLVSPTSGRSLNRQLAPPRMFGKLLIRPVSPDPQSSKSHTQEAEDTVPLSNTSEALLARSSSSGLLWSETKLRLELYFNLSPSTTILKALGYYGGKPVKRDVPGHLLIVRRSGSLGEANKYRALERSAVIAGGGSADPADLS